MGSPPMNFVQGNISSGKFIAEGLSIPAYHLNDQPDVTLGFRPEDCTVVKQGQGQLDAQVYTLEMTGDQSLVTFRSDHSSIVVKMAKDFEISPNTNAGIDFDTAQACFFDTATGQRLR